MRSQSSPEANFTCHILHPKNASTRRQLAEVKAPPERFPGRHPHPPRRPAPACAGPRARASATNIPSEALKELLGSPHALKRRASGGRHTRLGSLLLNGLGISSCWRGGVLGVGHLLRGFGERLQNSPGCFYYQTVSRCKAIERRLQNFADPLTEGARTAPRARCSRLPRQNGRSRVVREHASGRPSVRRMCGPERHGWVFFWRAILGALRCAGPCRPHSNDSHSRWGIHAHRRFTEGQSRNLRKAVERC
jgi:hypothetical protein